MSLHAQGSGTRLRWFSVLLAASAWTQSMLADDPVPPRLASALKSYEAEFLRALKPVQSKYTLALEGYLREFTQGGDLAAAKEAQDEIEQVKLWKTIPLEHKRGTRKPDNVRLASLQASYEAAVLEAAKPVTLRFLEQLERVKQELIAAREVDAALLVDAEIKRAIEGKSLPVEAGAKDYLSTLSKEEFGTWIQNQLFEFSGAIAGKTLLKFDASRVTYGEGVNAPIYEYRLAGTRSIEINGGVEAGGFTINFAKDLHSGTFTSRRAEYPLTINPDRAE
ncbi:MAG: hypothetical protein KDN18_09020 [Verrucomicrobiae bacterium]|nr:hypothetical protein [Verrucomicrobiae bacterium]